MLYRRIVAAASLALAAIPAPAWPAAPGGNPVPVVAFLGDSLTAGFGLAAAEEAYPALVADLLAGRGTPIRAINAGVSGDTSAGGLGRIDWLLKSRPAVVVVALGANDGLRGLPLASIEQNLAETVARARAAGARVLLAGMLMPPNYGGEYASGFAAIYPRVAQRQGVALVPFLLEGVAGHPELNQPDGIHPTAEGQRIVAQNLLPHLERLLDAPAATGAR